MFLFPFYQRGHIISSVILFYRTKIIIFLFRCATGEAWPDIMLDATSGRECDPKAVNYNKTTGN